MKLKIKKLHSDAKIPVLATKDSAGFDLSSMIDVNIEPSCVALIPTGIAVRIEKGHEGQVRPRSGLALKNGITVLNTPGTIDSDYSNEVGVILINHGPYPFVVTKGMRIAQLVINKLPEVEIEEVQELDETERKGGFGSSGH